MQSIYFRFFVEANKYNFSPNELIAKKGSVVRTEYALVQL